MKEKPFNNAIYVTYDDLPDSYRQEIVDLTEKIMVNALFDFKTKKERDPNIALGALQRALGLTIAKVFPKEDLQRMLDAAYVALVESAREWRE